MKHPRSKIKSRVTIVENDRLDSRSDYLTAEEPLEIRTLNPKRTLAITMRTPGNDFELVAGFLFGEGIIRERGDILAMSYCVDVVDGEQRENIVNIGLKDELTPSLPSLERHFFTNSACGLCGRASVEALKLRAEGHLKIEPAVNARVIYTLNEKLRQVQGLFSVTGGLHAAAAFSLAGELLRVREDVGRHNALDKLIGAAFLGDELPLDRCIVMVSGRSSFEILQKCIVAGAPIVCSVSAPSSLAVTLARDFGVTLVGFLRGEKFNIYSHPERIIIN